MSSTFGHLFSRHQGPCLSSLGQWIFRCTLGLWPCLSLSLLYFNLLFSDQFLSVDTAVFTLVLLVLRSLDRKETWDLIDYVDSPICQNPATPQHSPCLFLAFLCCQSLRMFKYLLRLLEVFLKMFAQLLHLLVDLSLSSPFLHSSAVTFQSA